MTAQSAQDGEVGEIPLAELDGGFDLHRTLASGQTYRWTCLDGDLFSPPPSLPTPWYETVAEGAIVRVRQNEDTIQWWGTDDIDQIVRRLLRLDDDLEAILAAGPSIPIYREAVEHHHGMRLVTDSLYVGLISFICSTNNNVRRIHGMVRSLMETFGDRLELDGHSAAAFPTPTQLADASDESLRACGLGYRAPYVKETAAAIATGEHPLPDPTEPYEPLRDALTVYPGVGPKVADCALLFGAGRLEPVPLDRWINRAIDRHVPSAAGSNYAETSRKIRARLGPYPGYAQTYLFHHLRTTTA